MHPVFNDIRSIHRGVDMLVGDTGYTSTSIEFHIPGSKRYFYWVLSPDGNAVVATEEFVFQHGAMLYVGMSFEPWSLWTRILGTHYIVS